MTPPLAREGMPSEDVVLVTNGGRAFILLDRLIAGSANLLKSSSLGGLQT
jgi:hypothetical protein